MEKDKGYNWLAILLAILSLSLPSNFSAYYDNYRLIWMLTFYGGSRGESRFLLAEEVGASYTIFFISALIIAAGAVLLVLMVIQKLNFKIPLKWLPATIMIAGVLVFIIAGYTVEVSIITGVDAVIFFNRFPNPLGILAAIAACVFSVMALIPNKKFK